jgi:hypothetical protein
MAMLPGERLGPYEILSAIGAGGMGEVYPARPRSTGRDLAINVVLSWFEELKQEVPAGKK